MMIDQNVYAFAFHFTKGYLEACKDLVGGSGFFPPDKEKLFSKLTLVHARENNGQITSMETIQVMREAFCFAWKLYV